MAETTPQVQRNLYGLGLSPISIANREDALDEEFIANKDAGLLGIYRIDKNTGDSAIYSAEYIAREKEHVKNFIHKCICDNTLGKVYKIDVDDKLVRVIKNDENIFTSECTFELGEDDINAIRFDFDIDLFVRESLAVIDPSNIGIEIQFSLIRNGITRNYVISENLESINNMAFAIDMGVISSVKENDAIRLNTLTIKTPEGFDNNKAAIVLHNILFAII